MNSWLPLNCYRKKPASVLLLLLLSVGCNDIRPITTQVDLSRDIRQQGPGQSVEVDLIGVNEQEAEQLWQIGIKEYWEKKANHTLPVFVTRSLPLQSNGEPVAFKTDDPIWDQWRKHEATRMVVMTNWPRPLPEATVPRIPDPHCKFYGIREDDWAGNQKTLEILIDNTGVQLKSVPLCAAASGDVPVLHASR